MIQSAVTTHTVSRVLLQVGPIRNKPIVHVHTNYVL